VSAFGALALEAVRDAVRRRIVPVIAVVSLFSLLAVDQCAGCDATLTWRGEHGVVPDVTGWTSLVLGAVLGLWTVTLAGVLAADHLAESLADGSAALVLARPVGRGQFAAARLAGALAVALTTGAALLGGAALLLHLRLGLPLLPAAHAWLACALGSIALGALAMTLSLHLARIATALLILAFIAAIALVDLLVLFSVELEGIPLVFERFAPPLVTTLVSALSPWVGGVPIEGGAAGLWLRLLLWSGAASGLLAVAFRRVEIGR
jgi:hypothetical protein